METLKRTGSAPRLPEGVPDEVRLLDRSWLAEQTAGGARLALFEPREFSRMRADVQRPFSTEHSANQALLATVAELEHRRVERDKTIRSLDCQLRSLQAEASQLHRALDFAERPFWRKLLRRA